MTSQAPISPLPRLRLAQDGFLPAVGFPTELSVSIHEQVIRPERDLVADFDQFGRVNDFGTGIGALPADARVLLAPARRQSLDGVAVILKELVQALTALFLHCADGCRILQDTEQLQLRQVWLVVVVDAPPVFVLNPFP